MLCGCKDASEQSGRVCDTEHPKSQMRTMQPVQHGLTQNPRLSSYWPSPFFMGAQGLSAGYRGHPAPNLARVVLDLY